MTDTAMTDLLATLEGKLTEDQLAQAREWLVPAPVTRRELTLEERGLVDELQEANAEARAADERKKSAQRAVSEALGPDLREGTSNGIVVVKLTSYDRTSVDANLLKQGWPEAAEACAVATPVAFWSTK